MGDSTLEMGHCQGSCKGCAEKSCGPVKGDRPLGGSGPLTGNVVMQEPARAWLKSWLYYHRWPLLFE